MGHNPLIQGNLSRQTKKKRRIVAAASKRSNDLKKYIRHPRLLILIVTDAVLLVAFQVHPLIERKSTSPHFILPRIKRALKKPRLIMVLFITCPSKKKVYYTYNGDEVILNTKTMIYVPS